MGRHRHRNHLLGIRLVIKTFETKKRLLFTPKAWCNSVARWLLGVRSDSGTIRIKNTANPSGESGPSFDIDVRETGKAIDPVLSESYPKKDDRKLLSPSMRWDAGKLAVDEEWITNQINKNMESTTTPEASPQSTDNTGASTATDATKTFAATFTDWATSDKKVLKLRLYALMSGSSGSHRLNPIDLEFTQSGMLKSVKQVNDKSISI